MTAFPLRILTPDGTALAESVDAIIAPGVEGSFGVMARHAPLVAALDTGILRLVNGTRHRFFVVRGGLVEAGAGGATILTEELIPSADEAEARMIVHRARHPEEAAPAKPAAH